MYQSDLTCILYQFPLDEITVLEIGLPVTSSGSFFQYCAQSKSEEDWALPVLGQATTPLPNEPLPETILCI